MTEPSRSRQELTALTSLRGIAAWWVVLFHIIPIMIGIVPLPALRVVARGYLAVDLFFLLSGFVIAMTYAERFETARAGTWLRFLGLRLGRIYPLHFAVLMLFLVNPLAVLLFSREGIPGPNYAPGYFVQSLFLVQNWGFSTREAWNIPAWSISTEWGAYLLFPLLVLLLRPARRPQPIARPAVKPLLVALAAGTRLLGGGGLGANITGFGLARCVLEFAIGMCLYAIHADLPRRSPAVSDRMAGAGVGLLLLWLVVPMPDWLVAPPAFALLILGLADPAGRLARLISVRPLAALGTVSYSTYMIHYFIKDWTKFLLVRPGVPAILPLVVYVLAVLGASFLLYRWIEAPARIWSRRVLAARAIPSPAAGPAAARVP